MINSRTYYLFSQLNSLMSSQFTLGDNQHIYNFWVKDFITILILHVWATSKGCMPRIRSSSRSGELVSTAILRRRLWAVLCSRWLSPLRTSILSSKIKIVYKNPSFTINKHFLHPFSSYISASPSRNLTNTIFQDGFNSFFVYPLLHLL